MYIIYVEAWEKASLHIMCHDGLAVVYAVHSNCSGEIDPTLLLHRWVPYDQIDAALE